MDTIIKIAQSTIQEWAYLNDSAYIFGEVFDQSNPNNRLCFTEQECYKLIILSKDLWDIVQYHGKQESSIVDLINKTWEEIGRSMLKIT